MEIHRLHFLFSSRRGNALIELSSPMCQQLMSVRFFFLVSCLVHSITAADEAFFDESETAPSVSVLCQGRLRHGVVAIGGETTGTTITFHRTTWELKLPDKASGDFAERNHKKPVVVTGTLRKVAATESRVRWIIDVTRITELSAREVPKDSATMTIRGTLRAALALSGNTPELSVNTTGQKWKLDLAANRPLQATAESLIGKSVLVTGTLPPPPEKNAVTNGKRQTPAPDTVRVKSIKAAPAPKSPPRVFK